MEQQPDVVHLQLVALQQERADLHPARGATAATYVVTAQDVGHALVVLVTASSNGATAAAISAAATGLPDGTGTTTTTTSTSGPKNTVAPTAVGSAVEGGKLTATAGTWTGSGTINYTYQWYRCDAAGAHCSSIHGATAGTYKLVARDVSHTMALTVTAKDTVGKANAYGSLVGPVAAPGLR